MRPETICGLLAEPSRLRVFSAITLGAKTTIEVAERAEVSVADVGKALRRLRDGRLVSGDNDELTAHPERFKEAMRQAAAEKPAEILHSDPQRNALLTSVFRDGRIRIMPEAPAKVRIVLEYLSENFEPGVEYSEPQVNRVLKRFHDDHASLRRYLIDTQLMTRSDGRYRRAG